MSLAKVNKLQTNNGLLSHIKLSQIVLHMKQQEIAGMKLLNLKCLAFISVATSLVISKVMLHVAN